MSITSDIRSYADTAVNQGKQALDSAQASLNDVTGQANEFVGRARDNVNDLRTSAEKIVNLDAVATAIEPYFAQLKEYSTAVTDRVEHAVDGLRSDERVAALIDSAESLGTTAARTVNERLVKPVQSLIGRDVQPTSSRRDATRKPAPKPRPTKSASTRPAAKSATRKPASTRSASVKTATKSAARKVPAKRTTKS